MCQLCIPQTPAYQFWSKKISHLLNNTFICIHIFKISRKFPSPQVYYLFNSLILLVGFLIIWLYSIVTYTHKKNNHPCNCNLLSKYIYVDGCIHSSNPGQLSTWTLLWKENLSEINWKGLKPLKDELTNTFAFNAKMFVDSDTTTITIIIIASINIVDIITKFITHPFWLTSIF